MASGDIPNLKEARRIIRNSFDPIEYVPVDTEKWDAAYDRFCKIIDA